MDAVLPDPEALKYVTALKILNFIKESARNRYRDDKLSTKDASRKIRKIVEEYLISKGVDPKISPTPLLDDKFINKLKKEKSSKARAEELKYAIVEHIEKHYEEDPEFYERFSDRLNKILEEYRNNWDILAIELEKLREEMKKGRELEYTFGFDPKKEMPFFGLLKQEIYGKKPIKELNSKDIELLVNLTSDAVEIIRKEIKVVDFWENYTKQKRLKAFLTSYLLDSISKSSLARKEKLIIKEGPSTYLSGRNETVFKKRNEIAQTLMELAYHIYGK